MVATGPPSAGYKFNTFNEIKSHSSILFNERMAILFYILDMKSMALNSNYDVNIMLEVRSTLLQIYKNIRTLLRNNPTVRATLNLETKEEGVYTTDVAINLVDRMVQFCEGHGYTTKRVFIITQELNKIEMMLKDVLQYFHYFIRPEFRQKPDIEIATERYKEIADKHTVEELKQIVGKNHKIDFGSLGSKRIELMHEEPYDNIVDGPIHAPHEPLEKDDDE